MEAECPSNNDGSLMMAGALLREPVVMARPRTLVDGLQTPGRTEEEGSMELQELKTDLQD